MSKSEMMNGKIVVSFDDNDPKDLKKKMKKSKEYQTMSKPQLVKLVEVLIEEN